MAQYKVPQDVEADDKLLGPFSFRQFVYLLISGGLIALMVGLFQLFPVLAIIPLPFLLLFGALALPLKKDQPMETYLAALVSFYLKPHKRIWTPGQRESTIKITAPKMVEESRTRNITGEEATHRLSFLANIVDTEGYAIKGANSSPMREDLVAEANATMDMFEATHFNDLENTIARDENERHQEIIQGMKAAIEQNENIGGVSGNSAEPIIRKSFQVSQPEPEKPILSSPTVVMPGVPVNDGNVEKTAAEQPKPAENNATNVAKPSIMELANNPDFSVATIEKEANRINEKGKGEVFISLH